MLSVQLRMTAIEFFQTAQGPNSYASFLPQLHLLHWHQNQTVVSRLDSLRLVYPDSHLISQLRCVKNVKTNKPRIKHLTFTLHICFSQIFSVSLTTWFLPIAQTKTYGCILVSYFVLIVHLQREILYCLYLQTISGIISLLIPC